MQPAISGDEVFDNIPGLAVQAPHKQRPGT
jgi:hypothetical protein